MPDWQARITNEIKNNASGSEMRAFSEANVEAIAMAFEGQGPDAQVANPAAGIRAVANMAAVHIPNFCYRSERNIDPPYCNNYDLGKASIRSGDKPPDDHWSRRELVDFALSGLHGHSMAEIYYTAAELNGTGIHFYGDVSLVLKRDAIPADTLVLDRNSYDVMRAPWADLFKQLAPLHHTALRQLIFRAISGLWGSDINSIGAYKVLFSGSLRNRRLTTGQISERVLDDEDYIEILKHGSFSTSDLEASRLRVADIAVENGIEASIASGRPASHVARLWLRQRREAVKALDRQGVATVVVSTAGRVKS